MGVQFASVYRHSLVDNSIVDSQAGSPAREWTILLCIDKIWQCDHRERRAHFHHGVFATVESPDIGTCRKGIVDELRLNRGSDAFRGIIGPLKKSTSVRFGQDNDILVILTCYLSD